MRRYDLVKGIESTLSLLHSLIKDRVTVVKDYQTLPRVVCHPAHINQVFMNILTNAAEAIEGDGEIVIRTRVVKDGVRIIIKDTGPGIPYEHLSRLFEPFFTTKSVGKGTGLGLSICEGIVRHHGGRIAVESRLGEGSVFSVELPLEPPKEVRDEAGWIG
jgi:signal transduction histidine kinase